ncbi:MAG: preprotein translocase subunit YajC [Clostridia bacterium]|nr:preprotein translocase subunit YajC [Clostridia bacterium]
MTGSNSWIFLVVIVVMFGGMMALSIIPQKKRQKQYTEMQSQIRVGTKIMTIGRLIGRIVKIYSDNTIDLDIGTEGKPVVIVINREAIGINLDAQAAGANGEKRNEVDRMPNASAKEGDISEVGKVIENEDNNKNDSI